MVVVSKVRSEMIRECIPRPGEFGALESVPVLETKSLQMSKIIIFLSKDSI